MSNMDLKKIIQQSFADCFGHRQSICASCLKMCAGLQKILESNNVPLCLIVRRGVESLLSCSLH